MVGYTHAAWLCSTTQAMTKVAAKSSAEQSAMTSRRNRVASRPYTSPASVTPIAEATYIHARVERSACARNRASLTVRPVRKAPTANRL